MLETLGILLIVVGAGGLALLGLYALLPGLILTHAWGRPARIRIEEKRLLSVADLTPQAMAHSVAAAVSSPHGPRLDPRLADDLFAELFSLRTDVATMTRELRNIREQLDLAGAFAAEGAALASALDAA